MSSAGNAAGTGARIALLNRGSRALIESLVKRIEKIETALEPNFQDYFVDAMAFPNKSDAFPNLFSEVVRPQPRVPEAISGTGRKRRRRV